MVLYESINFGECALASWNVGIYGYLHGENKSNFEILRIHHILQPGAGETNSPRNYVYTDRSKPTTVNLCPTLLQVGSDVLYMASYRELY